MKNSIISFALIATLLGASCTTVSAQESRLSAKVGVGFYSFDDFVSVVGLIGAAFNKCDHRDGNAYLLNPNLTVAYRLNSWCLLGAGYTFGAMNSKGYDVANTLIHSVAYRYSTFTVSAQTKYWNRGIWTLYGDYGAGATLFTDTVQKLSSETSALEKSTTRNVHVNFVVYPIGIQIGERCGGFIELGWGCRGFGNAGFFYNF